MASFTKKSLAEPSFCSARRVSSYASRHGLSQKEAMARLLAHGVWPERFRRNQSLLAPDAQIRLLDLPIFIAGCGGLGGNLAALLVRLGAGRLLLCDHDRFEESNLNRQLFCDESSIGELKAEAAARGLAKLASWGDWKPICQRLSAGNAERLIAESAIVMDCLDSVAGKAMLEKACAKAGKAYLHGSILHHEGFAFLSDPAGGAFQALQGGDHSSSGAGATLSHVPAGLAALMCALFVKWLSGGLPQSRLLHADFSALELASFQLP